MITHSAKELGQQKEQWVWGLKVATKWGEGGGGARTGQNLKKGGGGGSQYGRVCIK